MNRCVNNVFGYCTDKPNGKPFTTSRVAGYYKGMPDEVTITTTPCSLDPRTCGKYRSHTQQLKRFIKKGAILVPKSTSVERG
ncbi:hypothetical protein ES703_105359 [subsurface metagenome]